MNYHKIHRVIILVSALILCACDRVGAEPADVADRLKVAVLHKMIKYITWPEDRLPPDDIFTVGVVGKGRIRKALEDLEGQVAHGRTIAIRTFEVMADVEDCQILFVCDGRLEGIHGAQVLTVSDRAGFAQAGGMIELYQADDKVRFAINMKAVERAGFRISARLLKLAKVVSSDQKSFFLFGVKSYVVALGTTHTF